MKWILEKDLGFDIARFIGQCQQDEVDLARVETLDEPLRQVFAQIEAQPVVFAPEPAQQAGQEKGADGRDDA